MTSIIERLCVKTQQQTTRRTLEKTLWWAAALTALALCGCGGGPHDLPFRRSTTPTPGEDTQQQSTKTQPSNSATTAEPSDRTSETSDHTEEQTTDELEEPAAAAPAVVLGPSTHRTSFSFNYNTPESESPETPPEDTYHPPPAEDVQPNNSPATAHHAPQEPLFVSTPTSTSAATDITDHAEEHHNTATGDAPEPPQNITAFSNPQQMLEELYDVQRQQNSETAAAPQKAMQQTPPSSPPQHKQQHAKNQPQELSDPTTPCALSHHRNILYQGSSYQLTKWGQEAYLSEEGSLWALMQFFPSQSKKTFKEVILLQHITFVVREQKIFDGVAIVVRGTTAYAEFAGHSLPFADIAIGGQDAMISGSSASHHAADYAPAIHWSLKSYKACWANFYHRESKTTLGGISGRAAALILP